MNWSRPTDSGSTENARLENRKLFKILFKLLYLRFPPFQTRTCAFRTCIFHPCISVLTYSVLAYSILRYFRFPYLRFQSPRADVWFEKQFTHARGSRPSPIRFTASFTRCVDTRSPHLEEVGLTTRPDVRIGTEPSIQWNERTSPPLATFRHDICRHNNYAVEGGLVVGFCGQPHHCYRPYTIRQPGFDLHRHTWSLG